MCGVAFEENKIGSVEMFPNVRIDFFYINKFAASFFIDTRNKTFSNGKLVHINNGVPFGA